MSWATSGLLVLVLLAGAASAAPTTCKSGTGTGTTIKAAAAAATLTTDSTASLDSCRIEVKLSDTTYTVRFYGDATNDCSAGASAVTGLVYETCCATTDCNVFEAYVVRASIDIQMTDLVVADIDETKFCTAVAAVATATADVYKVGACDVESTTLTTADADGEVTVAFTVVTSGSTEATAVSGELLAAGLLTAFEAEDLIRATPAYTSNPAITADNVVKTTHAVVECYSGTATTSQTSYYTAPSATATVSDTTTSCRIKKLKSAATPPTYDTTVAGSAKPCPSTAADATLLYETCCEEDLCNEFKPVTLSGTIEIGDTTLAVADFDATYKTEFCTAVAAVISAADDEFEAAACTAGTATAGSAANKIKVPFTVLIPNRAAAEIADTAIVDATKTGETGFLTALKAAGTKSTDGGGAVTADSYTDATHIIVADPPIKCMEGTLEDAEDLMTDVAEADLAESTEAEFSSCRIRKVAITAADETVTYTTTYEGIVDEACPATTLPEAGDLIYESCCEEASCNVYEPYLVYGTATLTGTDQAASTFDAEDKDKFCEAIVGLASDGELAGAGACTVESVTDTPAAARKLLAATSVDVVFTLKAPYKASAELMETAIVESTDSTDFETALDAELTGLDLATDGLESKVITDPPVKCYSGELADSDDKDEKPETEESEAEWSSCILTKIRTEAADGSFTYDTVLEGSVDLCPEDAAADDEEAAKRRRRKMLAAGDTDDIFDLCCEEDLCNKLEDVKVKVQASLTLAGITAAAFGASQKAKFCAAVAKAAGNSVTADDCAVTAVTDSAGRRALQAGSVDVEFEVLVDDMAVGDDVGSALDSAVSDGTFDDELAAAGLSGLQASGFSFDVVTDTKGLSTPASPTTPTTPGTSTGIDWDDDDDKKKLALGLGIGLGLGIPVVLAIIIAAVIISRRKQQATSPAPPPGQYP